MKNILETTSQKVIEIREIKQAECMYPYKYNLKKIVYNYNFFKKYLILIVNEKKRQMETNYEDLHHKNEALKTILETVSAESENKITRLNIKVILNLLYTKYIKFDFFRKFLLYTICLLFDNESSMNMTWLR